MLNEPASSGNDRGRVYETLEAERLNGAAPRAEDNKLWRVRELVADVLVIERERHKESDFTEPEGVDMVLMNPNTPLVLVCEGRLMFDSEMAYEQLDEQLKTLDLFPVFREEKGKHVVYVVEGRYNPPPRAWWPNLVLFLITLVSVLVVGTERAAFDIGLEDTAAMEAILGNIWPNLWRGIPYAFAVLLILGAHELGHYFAARRHKVAVTLPYFLPVPPPFSFFGTFGAFIQLRQPIRNRKILLDIGASGPLVGLAFALPILLIGLMTSPRLPLSTGLMEGNSILYALSKFIVFGTFLPDASTDVIVNQLAWAGWIGLFVTGLNLIPIGQLDGGHVLYSLIGDRARMFYLPAIVALAVLTFATDGSMILILVLLLLLGRMYATPLDNITKLDKRRQLIAIATLIVFALVFVPVPLSVVTIESNPIPRGSSAWLPIIALMMQAAMRGILNHKGAKDAKKK